MILSVRIWKTTTPKEKTYKKKTNEKMKGKMLFYKREILDGWNYDFLS